MIEKRKMTKFQLKTAFEYFNDLFMKPGKKAAFSAFVYENHERLVPHYIALQNACYDEHRDPQFAEYNRRLQEIKLKYAATDENGRVLTQENGDVKIDMDKNGDAVRADMQKLNDEFKDLMGRLMNKQKTNGDIYNQVVEIEISSLAITQFIDECPPFIVGLFRTGAI
jgi:hypothetical protein